MLGITRSSAIPDEGALRWPGPAAMWRRHQPVLVPRAAPLRTRSAWQQAWQQAAQWARNLGDAEQTRRSPCCRCRLAGFISCGDARATPSSSDAAGDLDAVGALIPDGVRLQLDLPPARMAGQITRDWVSLFKGGGKT